MATPKDDLAGFMAVLVDQVEWLQNVSRSKALAVGVAFPGLIDPGTKRAFTSNLPAGGHAIEYILAEKVGRCLPMINDCQAFALSEANGGAGDGFKTIVGLIMGTGVGAGLVSGGALAERLNGSALEIGHAGVPQRTLAPRGLPLWSCGCGKQGCFEQYVSGPGLVALSKFRLGEHVTPPELVKRANNGEANCSAVLTEFIEIAAELLLLIQLNHDPDCIVIGGGLSAIQGLGEQLSDALGALRLGEMRPPALRIARHGDSSGARGAAMLAKKIMDEA
ncbi:ROK family protein [Rhizobium sp. L245/93]|uniref:ROK family protein n=1 Tax=Rhizobium sp. L245/93 TaxID=2819998 RepID=UPI00246847AA|nr:ROK family protein [Rhizobium sp. L245/93]